MRLRSLLGALFPVWMVACAAAGEPSSVSTAPPAGRWARIDAHAAEAPESAAATPETLASYLAGPARTDEEKARAIFRWIAAHIDYDLEAARRGGVSGGGEEALASRVAVCGGFSDLYATLARAAGLEVASIEGWARGMGYAVGDPVSGPPNHAWNAVRVGGRWMLVDSTWGAGALDETGVYRRRFEPWYFDPPPSELLFTHFPKDAAWQLASGPISREGFARLPYLRSTFFARGLELVSPDSCVIRAGSAPARVTLLKPPGAFVLARLFRGEERLPQEWVAVTDKGDRVIVEASPPPGAPTVLRIFAGDTTTTEGRIRRHEWAADFRIDNPGGGGASFPSAGGHP